MHAEEHILLRSGKECIMRIAFLATFIAAVLLAGGGNRAEAQLVLGQPRSVDPPINTEYSEWGCSVTRDRLTLVVASDWTHMGDENRGVRHRSRSREWPP